MTCTEPETRSTAAMPAPRETVRAMTVCMTGTILLKMHAWRIRTMIMEPVPMTPTSRFERSE